MARAHMTVPRNLRDWAEILFYAVLVVSMIATPLILMRDANDETARILEAQQQNLEANVRANIGAVLCVLAIEPEVRDRANINDCVRANLGPFEPTPATLP